VQRKQQSGTAGRPRQRLRAGADGQVATRGRIHGVPGNAGVAQFFCLATGCRWPSDANLRSCGPAGRAGTPLLEINPRKQQATVQTTEANQRAREAALALAQQDL